MENSKELVILHASDVHIASHRIYQLRKWLKRNHQRVDVVLLSGDLADMPLELFYTAPPQEIEDQHRLLDKVLEEFLPVATKIYYIPGNHDAITTFTTDASDSSPCNVHMRQVTMAPGLSLLGLGGSVPGFRRGVKVWDGFPYRNDLEFSSDLCRVIESMSSLPPSEAVILMTHVGPQHSSTSVSHVDPLNPIITGSDSLYQSICKEHMQSHVILNVHGHTHEGRGQTTIGATTVINPGPLMDGYFGVYLLRETKKCPSWKLVSTCLYRLTEH